MSSVALRNFSKLLRSSFLCPEITRISVDSRSQAAFRCLPLTRGEFAIVDADVFGEVSMHKWFLSGTYAARQKRIGDRQQLLYLHRQIIAPKKHNHTDHINRCPLDCRRKNIRECTPKQNSQNRGACNKKRFKGVYKRSPHTWFVWIDQIYIGTFYSEVDAALAYDEIARRRHGEFSVLNFPTGPPPQHHITTRSQRVTRFVGVRYCEVGRGYRAGISTKGEWRDLGVYQTEYEATQAFNAHFDALIDNSLPGPHPP